jgi:hypothetical protein
LNVLTSRINQSQLLSIHSQHANTNHASGSDGHRVVIDSGAGVHVTPNRAFIQNFGRLSRPNHLSGVFGQPEIATEGGEGVVQIGNYTLRVAEIIYAPTIKDTLLSYMKLSKDGHLIKVVGGKGMFVDKDGAAILRLSGQGDILTFDDQNFPPNDAPLPSVDLNVLTRSATRTVDMEIDHGAQKAIPAKAKPKKPNRHNGSDATAAAPGRPVLDAPPPIPPDPPSNDSPGDVELVHARYGHLCLRKLLQLAKSGAVKEDSPLLLSFGPNRKSKLALCEQSCDACLLGKAARLKFAQEMDHLADGPNDKVVGDVCGPIWQEAHTDGTVTKFYLSTITDVYSRHLEVLIIRSKDQASDHCISYLHRSRIDLRRDMKHFHTDGGTEYNKFEKVADRSGTKVTRTPVDTPQRNGIAERKNRTIMEMARSLLHHAHLNTAQFWQSAVETAVIIHNRCTIVGKTGKTMHELYTGHPPDISFLRVFGCDAFVRVVDPISKLAPRSEKGIFIGYDPKREYCYRIQVEGSNRIVVSRDVKFLESSFTVDRVDKVASNAREESSSQGKSAVPKSNKSNASNANSPVGERGKSDDRQQRELGDPSFMDSGGETHQTASSSSSMLNHDRSHSAVAEIRDSDGSSELDSQTRRRLEAASSREKQSRNNLIEDDRNRQGGSIENSNRRSNRARTHTKQTGLNLEDFGRAVLSISSDVGKSKSRYSNVSSLFQVNSGSTATHSPDTIPTKKIRVSDVKIPATVKAAMKDIYEKHWKAAMDSEYQSIIAHGTYRLVPTPIPSPNIVSCKWVFSVKEKDGWVIRFKARLVVRGFGQEYGVDYEETYSPVLKYKTLRLVLQIVATFDMELEVMDVQTAYLHAELKETVYMKQPEGYEQYHTQNDGGREIRRPLICLLRKALYGLKQAGREWNIHLDEFVRSLGFRRCASDTCLYVKLSRSGRLILLSVYVDDIPSAYSPVDSSEWGEIKAAFFDRFKIAFQPEADWILNMRITRDRQGNRIILDQQAYIEQILEDLHMEDCKTVSSPGAQDELSLVHSPSTESEIASMKTIPYRRAIGLLMYLSNTSRPDITHAVGCVARFIQNPGRKHWQAVLQILRYLSGTKDFGLLFVKLENPTSNASLEPSFSSTPPAAAIGSTSSTNHPSPIPLIGYADSNWAGCLDTRRSTTGMVLKFGGSIIDWSSKRQTTVALSSCEAEYMAVSDAARSILWAKNILGELRFIGCDSQESNPHPHHYSASLLVSTPHLINDNKSAIAMATNDVHHQRSKHIDLRYHFVRERIADGTLTLDWCSTQDQIADCLTKSLPPTSFLRARDHLVYSRSWLMNSKKKEENC